MFKKLQLTLFVFLLSSVSLFAQSQTVSGKITDSSTGEPLAAVTVQVDGTTRGEVTNVDGEYSISVSPGEILKITYIGFIDQFIEIEEGVTTVNIQLVPDIESLDELVITAYGNQKKKAITGAVSTISKQSIEGRPITSFGTALQGTAPGISVSNTSGQPGSGVSIQIRGAGSINASTAPLYVIDGVPVVNVNANGTGPSNVLNTLNPNDIESISILKDASSSALYGSRAANGVVLVTTKRGQQGAPTINFRVQRGVSNLAVDLHETLDAQEYYKIYFDESYARQIAGGATQADAVTAANADVIGQFNGVNPYDNANPFGADGNPVAGTSLVYDTDWIDRTIDTGINTEYDLNVSGGNEVTQYYVSTNLFEQEGILPGSDFSRGSVRLNLDTKINDFLNVSIQSNNVVTEQNSSQTGGGANNPLRTANLTSNVIPFFERDANNNIVTDPITGRKLYNYNNPVNIDFHPIGLAELDRFLNETQRSTNNIRLLANLTDEIDVSSTVSLDVINSKDNTFENGQHGNAVPQGARANQAYNRYVTLNISNSLNYSTVIKNHSIDAIVGQEYFSRHDEFLSAGRNDFVTEQLTEISAGSALNNANSSFSESRIISYFSRLNYGFNEKYFVTASVRRDGASQFGASERFGTFGSIGASWILSEESFMDNVDIFDNLKFRASYGTTGNNSIGNYAALGLLGFASAYDYNGLGGSTYTQLANPSLKWEVNISTDIGVEFEMLDNKLSGEFVYWTRTSSDLLFDRPIPVSSAGFSELTTNLAELENSGIEASLNYRIINNKDLVWSVNANITTINNEITSLPADFVQNGTKRFEVGVDRYQYFIQEWAGVDPANGDPLWYRDVVDGNGDPTGQRETTNDYSQADRYSQGSSLEDFFGGFGTNLNYKGFDFQAIFSYKAGGKIYDFERADLLHMGATPGVQLASEAKDAWTTDNTDTDVPRFIKNNPDNFNNTSSRFLYDGDYLRLKNVTLGYSVDQSLLDKINVRSLRVFVTGENLLTFAAYEGIDPELPRSGNSNNIFPASRTITAGINLGF